MKISPWIFQAKHSLEIAELLLKQNFYGWSIFISHQSAEIAIKGILNILGPTETIEPKLLYEKGRHRVRELIELLPFPLKAQWTDEELKNLEELDKGFVETRYPTRFSERPPFQNFTEEQAKNFYEVVKKLVDWCEKLSSRLLDLFSQVF